MMKRIFLYCLLVVSSQFLTSEALERAGRERNADVGDFYQEAIQIWNNMTNDRNNPSAFERAVHAIRALCENAVNSLRNIERSYKTFNDELNALIHFGRSNVSPAEAMRNGPFMGATGDLFRAMSEAVNSLLKRN